MATNPRRRQRAFALFSSAIAAAAVTLSPAGSANAVARPLAALADMAPPAVAPEQAVKKIEAINRLMLDNPTQWAGVWYDKARGKVVAAVPHGASDRTQAAARSATGSTGEVTQATRSFADLSRLSNEIITRGSIASVPIVSTGLDWEHNGVIVGLKSITDDARAALAADYGDAVTVRHVPTVPSQTDGPDRYRDRFPYWGGAAWSGYGSSGLHCSTAFPMQRSDGSKHFLVTAGHCTLPFPGDASTLNTEGTRWVNRIGTSDGYQNSLCETTESSCDIGTTKYGDISVIRVSGNDPRIYDGGKYATDSQAVVSTQTSMPAVGDSMCTSGATTGTTCGYRVVNNFTSIYATNSKGQRVLRSPVVETWNDSGPCILHGDSGGAVYKPVTGGARASGIMSSSNMVDGACSMYYTSIYYAQQLFDAVTVTS
ncbi:hypothetical protein ACIBHX_46370 [Nonomuraea sp. NPDC050536]|uniref:hypothetical protein n=1 Tax=Nonomuraea sp. NPDC050536 TaxID=3364366 RepID=UPI0037C6FDBC